MRLAGTGDTQDGLSPPEQCLPQHREGTDKDPGDHEMPGHEKPAITMVATGCRNDCRCQRNQDDKTPCGPIVPFHSHATPSLSVVRTFGTTRSVN